MLDLPPSSGVRLLFEDRPGAQRAYFEQTGIFPIIHVIAMQAQLAGDIGLVGALCEAFAESKRLGLAAMIESPVSTPMLGGDPDAVAEVFGADPWPYGIAPNRKALEVFLGDVFGHQHLTDRRLQVEDLFPERLPGGFE
ncbi:MAG: hypothetical protein HYU75_08350 [Betaproteobacteria bacterium]|nr:hypothetical protein [Betaproteobacteria bacterium]